MKHDDRQVTVPIRWGGGDAHLPCGTLTMSPDGTFVGRVSVDTAAFLREGVASIEVFPIPAWPMAQWPAPDLKARHMVVDKRHDHHGVPCGSDRYILVSNGVRGISTYLWTEAERWINEC